MSTEKNHLGQAARIANVILGGGGVACLLPLFYVIYNYGWTGKSQFASSAGMILYYGLPLLLAGLLFASLRLSPSSRITLSLTFFSTAASICAVEFILGFFSPAIFGKRTLWFPPNTKAEVREIVNAAKQFGVDFDTRSRLEVIVDLHEKGTIAVPAINPLGLLKKLEDGTMKSEISIAGTEVLPLGGISNIVTVLCNELGEYAIYGSDGHGFHNPKGIWDAKRVDIAALGDSYTHGACLPSDKNFVALVRKRYPATLNLGMSGEGPLTMLAAIQEYVQFVRPKVVLWFFYEGNDFTDLKNERNYPLLMRYLEGNFSQGLFHLQSEIDAALSNYIETVRARVQVLPEGKDATVINASALIEMAKAAVTLRNLRERLGLIYGANVQESVDYRAVSEDEMNLLGKILSQAKTAANGWGGRLYFVYLPERERYVDRHVATKDDKNRERVLRLARSLGLPVTDIHDAFQSQGDPLSFFPFRRLGHYNEQGNRVVTEAVLKSLALSN